MDYEKIIELQRRYREFCNRNPITLSEQNLEEMKLIAKEICEYCRNPAI